MDSSQTFPVFQHMDVGNGNGRILPPVSTRALTRPMDTGDGATGQRGDGATGATDFAANFGRSKDDRRR